MKVEEGMGEGSPFGQLWGCGIIWGMQKFIVRIERGESGFAGVQGFAGNDWIDECPKRNTN